MAINKKFIHFKTFENFNSMKLSANENDNQYTLGVDGEIQTGTPEILYRSICYIKDTQQQWTHGQLYNCGDTSKFSNDLTGVLEYNIEKFTFRPSAGNRSVRDASAKIKTIYGNTIIWNQLFKNGNFENNTTDWEAVDCSTSINTDGSLKLTATGSGSVSLSQSISVPIGHKILITVDYQRSVSVTSQLAVVVQYASGRKQSFISMGHNSISRRQDSIIMDLEVDVMNIIVQPYASSNTSHDVNIYSINCFDLTLMFGVGSEPTIEEFRQLFPNNFYPYCIPEFRNVTAKAIETTGFNQMLDSKVEVLPNQTYYFLEMPSTAYFSKTGLIADGISITIPTNKLYTAPSEGYIIATGASCINLSHTGIRNGEYADYEKHTLQLPSILKYFPNGMNGFMNVADEIRYNDVSKQLEAVQRISTIDLGSLNWTYNTTENGFSYFYAPISGMISNTKILRCIPYRVTSKDLSEELDDKSITGGSRSRIYIQDSSYTSASDFKTAMSGVMLYYLTNYEYVTPITEPMVMDYWVEDFGTEKVLSDTPSAPFVADIVYQFNAEGRIRDNSRNIQALVSNKQNTLVSGNNIKTINGQSLLGSGDITIDGGSSAYSEVSHGTADTTFTLTPNTFHIWDEVSSLTLTLGAETSGVANEYLFQFTSGNTATTLSLPDDIKWTGGETPTIEANKIYQISILKGLGSVLEFVNNVFFIGNKTYYYEIGMTWEEWVNSSYNTDNYAVYGNSIVNETQTYQILNVIKTDLISLHYSYVLTMGGYGPA